ncbi:uncharacterized protein MYCGRDRAFT_106257 [Zymoseptoria tritici IPO323]|uniref:Uncharacterized protein n=1 Tax=Zymoseptoria tritici (strain CBS 115943 / IPO323) TaxID=336722 RepID=F9XPF5_ZYMTI|nr:uncharacterized protein MYCGRDRAFT_106257 [Zymoseptoria tritici IPO323]EGP83211.1 hypothetical protein MYCGRDRAFT_106257 [Zymoseptoria tritici IPO323]
MTGRGMQLDGSTPVTAWRNICCTLTRAGRNWRWTNKAVALVRTPVARSKICAPADDKLWLIKLIRVHYTATKARLSAPWGPSINHEARTFLVLVAVN